MSNEQFSDCGTAYLSYEAHNKAMSYSTKTKLILLVAIMSIGSLSALRRRSVSSEMSYRTQVIKISIDSNDDTFILSLKCINNIFIHSCLRNYCAM